VHGERRDRQDPRQPDRGGHPDAKSASPPSEKSQNPV